MWLSPTAHRFAELSPTPTGSSDTCKSHFVHSESKSSPSFSAAASALGPKIAVFANSFHNASANLMTQTGLLGDRSRKAVPPQGLFPPGLTDHRVLVHTAQSFGRGQAISHWDLADGLGASQPRSCQRCAHILHLCFLFRIKSQMNTEVFFLLPTRTAEK